MSDFLLIAAAVASFYQPVSGNQTQFEANVRLPNGSYQRITVNADTPSSAKVMLQQQYCPQKKDCVVSGPHLTH